MSLVPELDDDFVAHAAALAGLSIPPDRLPAVTASLARTAQIAAMVNEFILAPEDEAGPVWRP
jgi:hypothetical protein